MRTLFMAGLISKGTSKRARALIERARDMGVDMQRLGKSGAWRLATEGVFVTCSNLDAVVSELDFMKGWEKGAREGVTCLVTEDGQGPTLCGSEVEISVAGPGWPVTCQGCLAEGGAR